MAKLEMAAYIRLGHPHSHLGVTGIPHFMLPPPATADPRHAVIITTDHNPINCCGHWPAVIVQHIHLWCSMDLENVASHVSTPRHLC
jgi:hypothetical protein